MKNLPVVVGDTAATWGAEDDLRDIQVSQVDAEDTGRTDSPRFQLSVSL